MKKAHIFSLPLPSTAATAGPTLVDEGDRLVVSITCVDDHDHARSFAVIFASPRAYRQRAEIYCTGWHVQGSFDTVCEVVESDWVDELRRDAVPEWRDRWMLRHFMIYLDGFGCLEVVAESVALDDGAKASMNAGGT